MTTCEDVITWTIGIMDTLDTSPVKCADTSCGDVLLPVGLMDILSFTAVHE